MPFRSAERRRAVPTPEPAAPRQRSRREALHHMGGSSAVRARERALGAGDAGDGAPRQ